MFLFRHSLPLESTPDLTCAYPACRPRFRFDFGRFGRAACGCWLLGGREELCGVFGPSNCSNRFSSSAIFANKNRTTAWASGGHFKIYSSVICNDISLFWLQSALEKSPISQDLPPQGVNGELAAAPLFVFPTPSLLEPERSRLD